MNLSLLTLSLLVRCQDAGSNPDDAQWEQAENTLNSQLPRRPTAPAEEQVSITATFSGENAGTFSPKKQSIFLSMFDYYCKTYVHTFNSEPNYEHLPPSYTSNIVGVWLATGDHRMLVCDGGEEYPCKLVKPIEPSLKEGIQMQFQVLTSRSQAKAIVNAVEDPQNKLGKFLKLENKGIKGAISFMMPIAQPVSAAAAAEEKNIDKYYQTENESGDHGVNWEKIMNTVDKAEKDGKLNPRAAPISGAQVMMLGGVVLVVGAIYTIGKQQSKEVMSALAQRRQQRQLRQQMEVLASDENPHSEANAHRFQRSVRSLSEIPS